MGIHMRLVDILLNALRGISVNATNCKACHMSAYTAQKAIDEYNGIVRNDEYKSP
jgi:hypothetical protein